jgi:hypothetical protein
MADKLPLGKSRDPAAQIPALNRFPHYLGTITATTTAKDNSTTAVPFTIPQGVAVMCQPDAACYLSSEFPAATVATTNSMLIGANERWVGFLWGTETIVAAKAVAGTVNVKVFKLEQG